MGVGAFSNQLQSLRSSLDIAKLQARNTNVKTGAAARSTRSVLGRETATKTSGGINTSVMSSNGSGTQLAGRSGVAVGSPFGGGDYDVKDLSVSPDGERITFAAHGPAGNAHDSTWNIYEYNFSTRQIRRFLADDEVANAGQDTNPAYTNDGRIVFSSDRQVGTGDYWLADRRAYIGDFNEPASLLHIMQPDGSQMVQITFGAYHDIEPNSMNDGQIVFIRWGREYENLYDCTADNIDDPNFSTHPHGGGYGHGNGDGYPPGLDKPKDWTTDDKCGASGLSTRPKIPGFRWSRGITMRSIPIS